SEAAATDNQNMGVRQLLLARWSDFGEDGLA
ncbi:MAG: hypothetical protein ACI81P_002055, partial [Neolewinella sp.]